MSAYRVGDRVGEATIEAVQTATDGRPLSADLRRPDGVLTRVAWRRLADAARTGAPVLGRVSRGNT